MPACSAVHSSFGPPSGQVLSRPVSVDTLSRLGPRHCGQSWAGRGGAGALAASTGTRTARTSTQPASSAFVFMGEPRGGLGLTPSVRSKTAFATGLAGGPGEAGDGGVRSRAVSSQYKRGAGECQAVGFAVGFAHMAPGLPGVDAFPWQAGG